MSESLSKSQQKALLIGTILASSMAFIDSTALNVALPVLQQDLNVGGTELLWIVNGYALFLSALLLVGGSLGDLYGRKKVFITGILVFTIASILCGISSSSFTLIVSRCLQGIGGALMVPGSLSLLSALIPKEKRGWAIGTWSMFSAMTTIFGPMLGGWLADLGLWRVVFFINVPIAIISLIFLVTKVPESKSFEQKKLDVLGAFLATIALAGISYGFIQVPDYGFSDYRIQASLVAGTLALAAFLFQESQSADAMMPLSIFKSRLFSVTNLITLFVYGALGGFLFFFPLNLIQVQGYSPKIAGITMLPFGILIAFLSRLSGQWSDKVGVRPPLVIGPACTSIGFYLFSIPTITGGPADFWGTYLLPILLLGVGMGITVAPLTTAVMNAVSTEHAGKASGVNNTVARSAGVLAIAIMGAWALISFEQSIIESTSNLSLSEQAQHELVLEIPKLADAKAPASTSEEKKSMISTFIKLAFMDTFKQLALIACIMTGLSALFSYFFLRSTGSVYNIK